MTSIVTSRRLRRIHSPDSAGRRLSLQPHNLEDQLRFYVCGSVRHTDSVLADLSSNKQDGLRCMSTLLPLELCEFLEPLISGNAEMHW